MTGAQLLVTTLHLFLSSFLVFMFYAVVIESTLFVFRIECPRTRSWLRLLPLIKLPVEMLLFILGVQQPFVNFNPFGCELYLQGLILQLLPVDIHMRSILHECYSLASFIAGTIPSFLTSILLLAIGGLSLFLLLRKALRVFQAKNDLSSILESVTPSSRIIVNEKLQSHLRKMNACVYFSDATYIPFAARRHDIVLPRKLVETLSQEEFEAVIVHELDHLRWKDPLLKLLLTTITTVFWWIPTGWWLQRIEEEREIASDSKIRHYGFSGVVLAEAVVKVIHYSKQGKQNTLASCQMVNEKSNTFKRIERLLESKPLTTSLIPSRSAIVICIATFFVVWVC